jgi:hypothetical protein
VTAPQFARGPEGDVRLSGLAPVYVHVLHEVPEILESQDGAVKARIYPMPCDDARMREDWQRLVHPDLFALVASAREVVREDLKRLVARENPPFFPTWDLTIPGAHVQAWLSALNAARLALGALHRIEEGDMDDWFGLPELDERGVAIVKIHYLGWLQQVLLDGLYPPPPDAASPGTPPGTPPAPAGG